MVRSADFAGLALSSAASASRDAIRPAARDRSGQTAGSAGAAAASSARSQRSMPAASRPAIARQSSREPCSMNRSGMPMCEQRRSMPRAARHSATRAAGAAGDDVFLDRDDRRVRRREPRDQLFVERLDEPHVDQRRVEPLGDRARTGATIVPNASSSKPAATFAAHLRPADRQRRASRARSRTPGPWPRG